MKKNDVPADFDPMGYVMDEMPSPFNDLDDDRPNGPWHSAEEAAELYGVTPEHVRKRWKKKLNSSEILPALEEIEYAYDFEHPGYKWENYWTPEKMPPPDADASLAPRQRITSWSPTSLQWEDRANAWLPDQDLDPEDRTPETAFYQIVQVVRFDRDDEGRWKRGRDGLVATYEPSQGGWDWGLEPSMRYRVEYAPEVYYGPRLEDMGWKGKQARNPGAPRGANGQFVSKKQQVVP